VYFWSVWGGPGWWHPGWWRVRISDHKAEPIAIPKNFAAGDYGWSTVAPDGSLIVARNIGTGDIYALDWELP
jgi:hypothetical protein